VPEFDRWVTRMEEQDEAETTEPKDRRCWSDIVAIFRTVWQGLGEPQDLLQFTTNTQSDYQVALSTVVFEYSLRHRMATLLPLATVSVNYHDRRLAVLLAIYNGVLLEKSIEQQPA